MKRYAWLALLLILAMAMLWPAGHRRRPKNRLFRKRRRLPRPLSKRNPCRGITGPFGWPWLCPARSTTWPFSQSMYDAPDRCPKTKWARITFELPIPRTCSWSMTPATAIRGRLCQPGLRSRAWPTVLVRQLACRDRPDFPDTREFRSGARPSIMFGIPNIYAYEASLGRGAAMSTAYWPPACPRAAFWAWIWPIETGTPSSTSIRLCGRCKATPDITVNVNYIGSFSDVAPGLRSG